MERNGTASNCAQYRRGRRICNGKLLICQLIRAHFVSCTRQEDKKTGQVPSRRYRATPSVLNILAVYLVSSSCVANPSFTNVGPAMLLTSLGSAEGSGVACGSPYRVLQILTTERPLSMFTSGELRVCREISQVYL